MFVPKLITRESSNINTKKIKYLGAIILKSGTITGDCGKHDLIRKNINLKSMVGKEEAD